jgi:hypothetical protein
VSRSDRLDRWFLTALGVLLVVVATYGLVRSYGGFDQAQAHQPVLTEGVRTFVGGNHNWFWPVAFFAALIIAYLGYRMLRAKLVPHPRQDDIREARDGDEFVVATSVVADAVAEDLARDRSIIRAHARVAQIDPVAEIDLSITVHEDVTFTEMRHHVEDEALGRAESALEGPCVTAHVTIVLAEAAQRQVR